MLTCSELKKIPVFACLNDVNLVWLSQQAADLCLEPGEYLIHEGAPTERRIPEMARTRSSNAPIHA